MLNDPNYLVVPDGTEVISRGRYKEKNMECLFIPKDVREIQEDAFRDCKNLREVMFEDGSALKKIGPNAFYGCIRLASFALPEGLEEIGMYAFYQSDICSVTFPASLRIVAQGAFAGCKSLKTAVLNEGLEVLGTDDGKKLGGVFQGSALESVELPSTLTTIGDSAFEGCRDLKKVKMSDGLERIGDRCFFGSGITEFVVPKSVTEIGKCVFQECAALKRISF